MCGPSPVGPRSVSTAPYSSPTLQMRKLGPRAQVLSPCPSTGDTAKTTSPALGHPLAELTLGDAVLPPTPTPTRGHPEKRTEPAHVCTDLIPAILVPKSRALSRPHVPSPGHPRPSRPPGPSPPGSQSRSQSPRGRSVPTLTLVEYGHMTWVCP